MKSLLVLAFLFVGTSSFAQDRIEAARQFGKAGGNYVMSVAMLSDIANNGCGLATFTERIATEEVVSAAKRRMPSITKDKMFGGEWARARRIAKEEIDGVFRRARANGQFNDVCINMSDAARTNFSQALAQWKAAKQAYQ